MNVSHKNKGLFLRCDDSYPFSVIDDERFGFLQNFGSWLQQWKNLNHKPRCGCLSEETFFALSQTTSAIINVIQKLLAHGSEPILTIKFQTDKLERRFSQYRQMSGSNYRVSVQQILESERKIKLKSILELHSNAHGTIALKNFVTKFSGIQNDQDCNIDLLPFSDLISTEVNLMNISQIDAEVLTYIAGYCASNIKVNCIGCLNFCLLDKDLIVEISDDDIFESMYMYIDVINRGGLKYPTVRIVLYSRGQKKRDTRCYSDTYHRREMKLVPFFMEKCPL